jgi:hypothetical protein
MFFLPNIIFTLYLPPYTLFFLTNRNIVVEVEKRNVVVGFLDTECLCSIMLNSTDDTLAFSVSYTCCAFKLYPKKKLILTAYPVRHHWIAVAIIPKQ